MSREDFMDLFIDELNDIYSAETQLVKALPKMVDAASSPDLKNAFEAHLKETRKQVERLEKVFTALGEKMGRETCEAMKGLALECEQVVQLYPQSALRDAALIVSAQKIEHYEIATYGALCTFAQELDLDDIQELLGETLDEEKSADEKLTGIAEGGLLSAGINQKALDR
ncbi:Protein YciF [Chlamydiales bacterium STE3]|nr:Protein YciF [Chlamydiales bacterium STE3]